MKKYPFIANIHKKNDNSKYFVCFLSKSRTFENCKLIIIKKHMSKDYSTSTVKYIAAVKKFLKTKYGKINDEWNGVIEILADNVELYLQCRNSIFQDGLMMTAKNGAPTRNPLIKTMFDAQIQVTKLLTEFGLTPRAAAKINLVGDDNDELKELLGD